MSCAARRVVVRPANRFIVDRAARRTQRLVAVAEPEQVEALEESLDHALTVGQRW